MSFADRLWIETIASSAWAIFEDGFDLSDVPQLLDQLADIVGQVDTLDEAAKRQAIGDALDYLLAENDGPGPDSLIDPLVSTVAKLWLIPYLPL